ncbi:MAG: hypothetical protein Q4A64_07035 [Porphyromonadaceae bacterium]|nr:hypothetical protein [Porphyromonadaceae bacterium]
MAQNKEVQKAKMSLNIWSHAMLFIGLIFIFFLFIMVMVAIANELPSISIVLMVIFGAISIIPMFVWSSLLKGVSLLLDNIDNGKQSEETKIEENAPAENLTLQ